MDDRPINRNVTNVGDVGGRPRSSSDASVISETPLTVDRYHVRQLPSSLKQFGPKSTTGLNSASASTRSASSATETRFDEIMKQIAEADKRNTDKIAECNRNIEEQVTQLSDGLSKMQDMLNMLANKQLQDKKNREQELTSIEARFNSQHKQLTANGTQLTDVTKLLAKMQVTMDGISSRLPDDGTGSLATKIRKVDDVEGMLS